jgi:hypothetical protein
LVDGPVDVTPHAADLDLRLVDEPTITWCVPGRGITVLLSGVDVGHEQVLTTLGITEQLRLDGQVFADTSTAISYARHRVPHP